MIDNVQSIPTWGYKNGEGRLFHLQPGEKLPEGWEDSPHGQQPKPSEPSPEPPAPAIVPEQPLEATDFVVDYDGLDKAEATVEVTETLPPSELPPIETNIEVLRARAVALGMNVDARWSARTLRKMIASAEQNDQE